MNTTIAMAKRRFKSHTRSVLSDRALAAARRSIDWRVIGEGDAAVPTAILGDDEFRLEFFTTPHGHTFARCNGARFAFF